MSNLITCHVLHVKDKCHMLNVEKIDIKMDCIKFFNVFSVLEVLDSNPVYFGLIYVSLCALTVPKSSQIPYLLSQPAPSHHQHQLL